MVELIFAFASLFLVWFFTFTIYLLFIAAGLIKQPFNTWSALFMTVAGLWILSTIATSKKQPTNNKMTSNIFFPATYGFLAVYLGPGSMESCTKFNTHINRLFMVRLHILEDIWTLSPCIFGWDLFLPTIFSG